jgi:predicted metal-dependent RNase
MKRDQIVVYIKVNLDFTKDLILNNNTTQLKFRISFQTQWDNLKSSKTMNQSMLKVVKIVSFN